MKLTSEVLKNYSIDVTSGGTEGLAYNLTESAENGKDNKSLYKTRDLNAVLGYAADLITLEDLKDATLSLTEFADYRDKLFKSLNESMKPKQPIVQEVSA